MAQSPHSVPQPARISSLETALDAVLGQRAEVCRWQPVVPVAAESAGLHLV
jgi:hypothetical protein